MNKTTESPVADKRVHFAATARTWCNVIVSLLLLSGLACQRVASQSAEAMQEAEEYFKGLSSDFGAVNDRINQATEAYEKFGECVKGSGDVGKECQQYIDLLYNTAGIEVHDQVMEGKMMMEEMLKQFEESGVYEQLVSAKKIFSAVGTVMSDTHSALEFANKFNPEGARGDPTRGLNLIGEAIGGAADKLPYPMNEIFKGYSEAVSGISKQLVQLQGTLENARQGNLGGGYAMFADAQAYFENTFTGRGGRGTDLYFNVSTQFPLLGNSVQVFQDLISAEGEYYIYEHASAEIGENGWLAPSTFATVYQYFAALPNRSVVPPAFRVQRLVAQATTNPGSRIAQAQKHYQDFLSVRNSDNTQRLLEELGLLTTMNNLLTHSENAFIGLWLFVDETQAEIQKVADALAYYVYVEGTVTRIEDTGTSSPATDAAVTLNVDGGGVGTATTDGQGGYFVFARGEPQLTFSLKAGAEGDTVRLSSRFLSRGYDDVDLVLEGTRKSPVSISVSPENATLQPGQMATFRALAIFEDGSTLDITGLPQTTWSPGSNVFTATEETEAGEHTVTATYMNMEGSAVVTVTDIEETADCAENETWDEDLNTCVCIEGYEWIEELGRCANLDEAIDEMNDEPEDALCDEKLMAERLARLRQIIAESRLKSASLTNLTDQFMKVVNDRTSGLCHNQTAATAYAGARQLTEELQAYETEATEISSELILESAICGTADPDYSVASILSLTGELGPPLAMANQGISQMEAELMTNGCDQEEVADLGEAVTDVTGDPEVISGLGQVPGTGPGGPSIDGTTGVVAVVYDGTNAPLNSLTISVNFSFNSYSFFLSRDGQDNRYFQNAQLGPGDVMQISVPGASLNASITLLSSDFIWIDPATQQQASPGEGFSFFTVIVGVYFDDDEDVNRYRMIVGIGTLGMGIPGFPEGSGRELNY